MCLDAATISMTIGRDGHIESTSSSSVRKDGVGHRAFFIIELEPGETNWVDRSFGVEGG